MVKIRISIIAMALGLFIVSCSETEKENEATSTEKETTEIVEITEEIGEVLTIAKDVNADEFKSLFESGNGTLVDVRTLGEVEMGAIDGSVNIDFNSGNFETEIVKLDKNEPVYVYCAAGGRSGSAMRMMNEMGFTEVYNLVGGYGNWPFK